MPSTDDAAPKKDIPIEQLCRCANCGAESDYEDLDPDIPDIFERTEAGCEMPAGECKECGSLTYLAQNPYRRETAALLRRIAAEIECPVNDVPSRLKDMLDEILKAADDMYPEH